MLGYILCRKVMIPTSCMYLIFKLCGFFLFLLGCIAARKAYQFQETLQVQKQSPSCSIIVKVKGDSGLAILSRSPLKPASAHLNSDLVRVLRYEAIRPRHRPFFHSSSQPSTSFSPSSLLRSFNYMPFFHSQVQPATPSTLSSL
jgi:hypothetical protein